MCLLSSMVFFWKISSLYSFFQSSSLLFDTLVHRNATVGSMSGIPLFVMYNHLAVTLCSVSLGFWYRNSFVSSTHSKCLATGVYTFTLASSLKISIASSIYFLIEISTLFSFVIVRSIPRRSCVLPRVIGRPLNFSFNTVNISLRTFDSLCEILLLSTYHPIVHWFPLIILFAMHLSYGFISKPISLSVLKYRSYHRKADFIHP